MSPSTLVEFAVPDLDIRARAGAALRAADRDLEESQRALGRILVTSQWSSKGLRALQDDLGVARGLIGDCRRVLDEVTRTMHVR